MVKRVPYSVPAPPLLGEAAKPINYKIVYELVPSADPEKYPPVPIIIPKRRHLIPSIFVTPVRPPFSDA